MNVEAVLIAGPTASGKTQAALALAEAIGGVIINADSMQIYRELPILTARPDEAALSRVPHLLFGHVSARERYSVGRYSADAEDALAKVRSAQGVPIFVGGTGLYFHALTDGIPDMPAVPASIRTQVRAQLERVGRIAFHSELRDRDPEAASVIRASDTQRLLRAMEVLAATGRPLSQWQLERPRPVLRGLKVAKFVLDVPRPELREQIAQRFRGMIHAGACNEARSCSDLDPSLPAAKALGLRELVSAARGEISEAEATKRAVLRTGQFAKRQTTWFRHRMADWHWVSAAHSRNIIAEMVQTTA